MSKQEEAKETREQRFTRREVLRVGWTVPVIAAIELGKPKTVFANGGGSHLDFTDHGDDSIHNDESHRDFSHEDSPHYDHIDGSPSMHYDLPGHSDHQDGTNPGGIHQDSYIDSHRDHGDSHIDGTHGDSPHVDSGSVPEQQNSPHLDITSHEDHLDHIDSG